MLPLEQEIQNMNRSLILFTIMIMCEACNETNQLQYEKLSGKWAVREAWRNDNATQTFDGAYFDFQTDKLITNYQGDIIESSYQQQADTIFQMEPESLYFIIGRTHYDTIYLTTHLHGTNFKFLLTKS